MDDAEPAIEISRIDDFAGLGQIWRDLESRADGSFFQSWAWTGCLAEERFPEPWLMSARRGDKIVALALFNRRPPSLFRRRAMLLLGETGAPGADSIFVEHNGLLIDRSEPASCADLCWIKLTESALGSAQWIVSGVPQPAHDALARMRRVRITAERPAPYINYAGNPEGCDTLGAMSANARQQLRRSLRGWDSMGPLRLDVARSQQEIDEYFDGLKTLHQRYWTSRGKPGAFAEPMFERFHRDLPGRVGPGQSTDLIRISAGDRIVGYLYNLVHHGWVASYQSGIEYGPDADRLRPGLVCHLLAIEHYRRASMRIYDFLGGEARYKRSFANADRSLLWLEASPVSSRFAFGRRLSAGP